MPRCCWYDCEYWKWERWIQWILDSIQWNLNGFCPGKMLMLKLLLLFACFAIESLFSYFALILLEVCWFFSSSFLHKYRIPRSAQVLLWILWAQSTWNFLGWRNFEKIKVFLVQFWSSSFFLVSRTEPKDQTWMFQFFEFYSGITFPLNFHSFHPLSHRHWSNQTNSSTFWSKSKKGEKGNIQICVLLENFWTFLLPSRFHCMLFLFENVHFFACFLLLWFGKAEKICSRICQFKICSLQSPREDEEEQKFFCSCSTKSKAKKVTNLKFLECFLLFFLLVENMRNGNMNRNSDSRKRKEGIVKINQEIMNGRNDFSGEFPLRVLKNSVGNGWELISQGKLFPLVPPLKTKNKGSRIQETCRMSAIKNGWWTLVFQQHQQGSNSERNLCLFVTNFVPRIYVWTQGIRLGPLGAVNNAHHARPKS